MKSRIDWGMLGGTDDAVDRSITMELLLSGPSGSDRGAARIGMTSEQFLSIGRPELLNDGSDREFRLLIQSIFGVAGHFHALSEKVAGRLGLRGGQYRILMALLQFGGTTVNELARYLHVRPNYVTGELRDLQEQRLIRRRTNPRDGRSVLVELTPQGRRALIDIMPAVRATNDHIFRDLTPAQFHTLRALLDQLLATLPGALDILDR